MKGREKMQERNKDAGFEKNLLNRPAILCNAPIFNEMLPILRPNLPAFRDLEKEWEQVLLSNQITNAKQVKKFEEHVAEYLGVKHCVAVSSCTSGLMLTLRSLNIQGEVVIPSFTFFATAHALLWNGITPVFVDCELDTFNIDPIQVESAITPRTKAILAIHMYGNPAEIKKLDMISKKYNIPLIFDAAHAFGALYQNQSIGQFGMAEIFSLSPTKTLISGEGGLVTTNDAGLARLIRLGRNYGDGGNYDPVYVGLNARMSEFHATLGLHSLKHVQYEIDRRNHITEKYQHCLKDIPGIEFQKIRSGNRSTYKDFSILIDENKFGLSRDEVCRALETENIMTKKYFYPPVHRQTIYSAIYESQKKQLNNTDSISNRVVSLPIYSRLLDEEVNKICNAIERIKQFSSEIKETISSLCV